jgi:hypothetical protein
LTARKPSLAAVVGETRRSAFPDKRESARTG